MSSRPRPQRQAPLRLPPAFWHMTALIAALAAAVMLSLQGNALLTVAGLLAAGTAITAQAEARFRARHGHPSELADVLTTALALATVLTCILSLAPPTSRVEGSLPISETSRSLPPSSPWPRDSGGVLVGVSKDRLVGFQHP
jgi:hypothetical protein